MSIWPVHELTFSLCQSDMSFDKSTSSVVQNDAVTILNFALIDQSESLYTH